MRACQIKREKNRTETKTRFHSKRKKKPKDRQYKSFRESPLGIATYTASINFLQEPPMYGVKLS